MDKILKPSTQKYFLSLYGSFIPAFKMETPTPTPTPEPYKKNHKITITNKVYYKANYYVNGKKIKHCYWNKDELKSNLDRYKEYNLDINKYDNHINITYKN